MKFVCLCGFETVELRGFSTINAEYGWVRHLKPEYRYMALVAGGADVPYHMTEMIHIPERDRYEVNCPACGTLVEPSREFGKALMASLAKRYEDWKTAREFEEYERLKAKFGEVE